MNPSRDGSPTDSDSDPSPPEENPPVLPAAPPHAGRRRPGQTASKLSRRREDPSAGFRRAGWDNYAVQSRRDELIDGAVVDQLRKEFGDPFDDSVIKNAN